MMMFSSKLFMRDDRVIGASRSLAAGCFIKKSVGGVKDIDLLHADRGSQKGQM